MRPPFVRAAAVAATALLTAVCFAENGGVPMLSRPSSVATPNPAATQPSANVGVSPRSPEKSDIQQLLADTVDAALSKGELPTLESHLSNANQQAIGDLRDKQWPDLDGRIEEFRKDWRAKFGIDFKLGDKQSVVFADESFPIRPGNEASENATNHVGAGAPTSQPGAATDATPNSMPGMGGTTQPAGGGTPLTGNPVEPSSGTTPAAGAGQPSAFANMPPAGNTNAGAGTGTGTAQIGNDDLSRQESMAVRTGIVTLPETPSSPPRTLHLVNEGQVVPIWHIQLPHGVTAQRLHDSLLARLTQLDENSASWPTELNQAYQAVAREVLVALLDSGTSTTQP